MFLDTRLSNTPRWYINKPKGWNMRIHDSILDCVVFVGRILRKGSQEENRLTGTAFIVEMPLLDETTIFYLVTAKHIADRLVSGGEWFIRFNTQDGGYDEIRGDEHTKWWTHPDLDQNQSVDVAVMPLPLPATAKFARIPVSMFATDAAISERGIGPGSEAFITGLFTKMIGRGRNFPLIRMASVAMMPSEKIPNIKIGDWIGESDVYLLEARSLGGLSGSPVFVLETLGIASRRTDLPDTPTKRVLGIGETLLLGLMNGHWLIREKETNSVEIQSVRDEEGSIATGISVVVPAKKILEVINHPDLQTQRATAMMQRLAAQGVTTHD